MCRTTQNETGNNGFRSNSIVAKQRLWHEMCTWSWSVDHDYVAWRLSRIHQHPGGLLQPELLRWEDLHVRAIHLRVPLQTVSKYWTAMLKTFGCNELPLGQLSLRGLSGQGVSDSFTEWMYDCFELIVTDRVTLIGKRVCTFCPFHCPSTRSKCTAHQCHGDSDGDARCEWTLKIYLHVPYSSPSKF